MSEETLNLESTLEQLTLEEKIRLVSGASLWRTHAIPEKGIPVLKVSDGPNGVRGDGGQASVSYPVGIALGASWNPDLIERVGAAIAQDAKDKDVQVVLGPTINLQRTPIGGRNFECYSEDPLLSGELARAFTKGVQSERVGACLKHFVCNDTEFERQTVSSTVDAQTLREVYLKPFEIALREKPWTIMAAYNRINGIYACSHKNLLVDILKTEWGFEGLVMSDWWAAKETVPNALGGLDLEMPGPTTVWGDALLEAVQKGVVAEDVIDDKVRRLLTVLDWSGRFEAPEEKPEQVSCSQQSVQAAYEAAVEGMVLLKNEDVLPLAQSSLQRVALIGPNLREYRIMGGGSSSLKPESLSEPMAALAAAAPHIEWTTAIGCKTHKYLPGPERSLLRPLVSEGADGQHIKQGLRATFYDEKGEVVLDRVMAQNVIAASFIESRTHRVTLEGQFLPNLDGDHFFGLLSTGFAKMWIDGELLIDNATSRESGEAFFMQGSTERHASIACRVGVAVAIRIEYEADPDPEKNFRAFRYGILPPEQMDPVEEAVSVASEADAVLIFAGTNDDWETEGHDREVMELPGRQDELIQRVCEINPNTVVLLNSGSPTAMPWLAEARAVLQIWFPGQSMGRALADILFGHVSPSGRLPQTFPKTLSDAPAMADYPGENGVMRYGEGINVGHRAYIQHGVEPLFAFGHGLTYAAFDYGAPSLVKTEAGLSVELEVRHCGVVPAQETIQIYARFGDEPWPKPAQVLVGFRKVLIEPGASVTVRVPLEGSMFHAWDEARAAWQPITQPATLMVGASATDIRAELALMPKDLTH